MKQISSAIVLFLLLTCFVLLPTESQAVEISASGLCGDNLTWSLTSAGELKIAGSGSMSDYASASDAPWYILRTSIRSVVIEDGVLSIGDRAFYCCAALTNITIPGSVSSIGNYAFDGCTRLTTIAIPVSVTSIGREAFGSCTSLTTVFYKGTKEQKDMISVGFANGWLTDATWYFVNEDGNPFTDVNVDAFYYEPVKWAVANGITTGKTDTTFDPTGECTRAQVVTFLWRAAGKPDPQSTNNSCPDVANGKYFTKAVLWAAEQGITGGYKDGTFRPNNTCTRDQIVTFLYRAIVD